MPARCHEVRLTVTEQLEISVPSRRVAHVYGPAYAWTQQLITVLRERGLEITSPTAFPGTIIRRDDPITGEIVFRQVIPEDE
jgi:hypothetical protein